MKYLIDGIDRLGKSTLVQNLQQELGYHLVIHYDKPKALRAYSKDSALHTYQREANRNMFELLSSKANLIFDRTHLGEVVYAPLYRLYPGDYVFAMEEIFLMNKPYTSTYDVKLILLTTSNLDLATDDGLSFNPKNKGIEQDAFIQAFNKSKINDKIMIDVHDGNGNFRSKEDILLEVLAK